jgi:hypothetical protein
LAFQLTLTLQQLQNHIKRDSDSYRAEFFQVNTIFDLLSVDLLSLNCPGKHGPGDLTSDCCPLNYFVWLATACCVICYLCKLFAQQIRHYESGLAIFKLRPSEESKAFGELCLFIVSCRFSSAFCCANLLFLVILQW